MKMFRELPAAVAAGLPSASAALRSAPLSVSLAATIAAPLSAPPLAVALAATFLLTAAPARAEHAHSHDAESAAESAPDAGTSELDAARSRRLNELLAVPEDNVRAALDDPGRPAADRSRDAAEKPEAILRASGLGRGMRVADVSVGDGWFVQVLPAAVRRGGKVWANQDPALAGDAEARAWSERLKNPNTSDLSSSRLPLASPLPAWAESLDVIFVRGAYSEAVARGVDRAAMNAALVAKIAPGGKLLVVDARAAEGADPLGAAALCRVGEALVKKELEAAGFRLLESSPALHDAADAAAGSACGRDGADRLLLVFEKPKP